MKYIVENWFVIVGLIAVCAAGGYLIYEEYLQKYRENS